MTNTENSFIASAKRVIDIEAKAISALNHRLDAHFVDACHLLRQCKGKVVVSGMGKSGHIGNKIAATLASTGTPAFFMHPGEANHGDLGMLSKNDVLIAISNSGETAELVNLLPVVKRLNVPIIAMTNSRQSALGQHANIVLDISVEKEACSLGLAPTSSTTATLVMGDALAVALLDDRGFTSDDFALSHPGGSLGRKLLLKVSDIMLTGDDLPIVNHHVSVAEALLEVSKKGLGMTGIVDDKNTLVGVFTDGDLRRNLTDDLLDRTASQLMTAEPQTIRVDALAAEAVRVMNERKITGLFVTDGAVPVGILHIHDCLKAGIS